MTKASVALANKISQDLPQTFFSVYGCPITVEPGPRFIWRIRTIDNGLQVRLANRRIVVRWTRLVLALLIIGVAGVVLPPASPATAQQRSDPSLRVVDAWDVTGPNTFPGSSTPQQAQRPAITEAANGDFLVSFNTVGDGHPGGELRLIRSTDRGRTWGPSELIATSTLFGERGSIAATRGIATLADGTILLPYNDMVNHSAFNNRESRLFVARSNDNGRTWTGTDRPVQLPTAIREAHASGSPILTLSDGTLLLGIWGAKELVPNWETSPMPGRSGVLRSFDGGRTWSDYNVIAFDPHNPPQYPPLGWTKYPGGANEFALQELPDGRVMAVLRYATGVGPNRGQSYLSYSADRGATWTPPVPMGAAMAGVGVEALSVTAAPCTDRLTNGQSKLLLGHRVLNAAGQRIGQTAVRVSFDDGASWGSPVTLRDATGNTNLGAVTGEPTFLRLNDRQVLVLFQVAQTSVIRIVANLLEDATTEAECREQATTAAADDLQTVFVERGDRDAWPWPLATTSKRYPRNTLISDVAADAAVGTTCSPTHGRLRMRDSGRTLNPNQTLAEAGVENGEVLVFDDKTKRRPWPRIGHNELDTAPETRPLYAWNNICDYGFNFDQRARSLGIDLGPARSRLETIELVDSDTGSRLDQPDSPYRVLVSEDNQNFTELTGWSFNSRIENGRLVHRLANLNTTMRYVKITQPYTDTSGTFRLESLRSDVRLTIGRP